MLTPNEAREKEDRSADPDPGADRLYMASNIQPIGASEPAAAPAQPVESEEA
jgi:hypothetical protein